MSPGLAYALSCGCFSPSGADGPAAVPASGAFTTRWSKCSAGLRSSVWAAHTASRAGHSGNCLCADSERSAQHVPCHLCTFSKLPRSPAEKSSCDEKGKRLYSKSLVWSVNALPGEVRNGMTGNVKPG